ncbi:hypothetical protein ACGFS9_08805 [Streptomyces sp. NPDC048566]|uniref:hypothetical protein n=1 Tax=Streptomyces sp. NPDC048566 TaxID=3365569 RepID=UPI003710717C
MEITEETLRRAWREATARHELLGRVALPPLALSRDELAECAEHANGDGLCLLLGDDGTLHGHHGEYREVFATRRLDQAQYLLAEEAVRRLGGGPAAIAAALDRIDPAWGRLYRGGGLDETGPTEPCGRDPLEGLAWVAPAWRDQDPYTTLAFFRAAGGRTVDAERLAVLHGADPAQVAAETTLRDLESVEGGRAHAARAWESCSYGQAGDWTFLLYHDRPSGSFADKDAYAALGISESVRLTATAAKAIYTFDYTRDGRRVDDGWGVLELIWYEPGRAPYLRGGELDFLNRAVRRAELDHPEVSNGFALYFHALEESLGLRLPRRDFAAQEGRTAYWADGRH